MANDEGLLATPLGDFLYRHNLLDGVGAGRGLREVYENSRGRRGASPAGWDAAEP
ncbi:MAG TPA: hypothetical protein VIR45_05560 [Kiloniellaceae bacterium]